MSTLTAKVLADFTTSLATSMAVGATTATLQSATDDDGVALPTGRYYLTLDGSNSSKEHISCTLTSTALTNIKSVSRQGVETTGVARAHRIGSTVSLTDFAHIKVINDLINGTTDLDSSVPLKYDGVATIANATQLATKAYVDATATGTTNINRLVFTGTAGETITIGQLIYLKISDGRWWLADADTIATVENIILGLAQGSGTAGASITGGVLTYGLDTNQTGLTTDSVYYASNTPGGLSLTAGTTEVTVGYSQSTTSIFFNPRYNQQLTEDQQDALAGTSTSTPNGSNKFVDNADTTNGNNVDQSQTTQDATVAFGEADATTKYYKIEQSFVAGKSPIVSVDLWKAANTGTYTGDVTIGIFADSGGSPTGSALATVTSANAAYNALSTGANTFTFSASFVPTLGTTYCIVITSSTGDNSNHPNLGTNSAGGYGSGSVKFNNTTDGWTAIATIDLYFKVNTTLASKLVRMDTNSKLPAIDGSQLTGVTATSLSKQVTSGENIAAGVPAWIYNADSKAYTSHGFKELDSTALNLTSSTSNKVAKLSDTQVMFLTDNGTTTLTITVYDINSAASVASQTVTTAFDQTTASTATLPSATMCRLSDTTFVVFYAHTTTNDLYFRTGTISGGTITMDTETAYPGSPTYCYGMTAVPGASDGKVVFTYFDMTMETGSGGDSVQTLSYLTVAANSVTVTTTVSYTLSSGGYNVAPQWSNCCFTNGIAYGLFSCKDGGGIAQVSYNYINTVNSVTASNQYTLNLESQTGSGVSAAYATIIPSLVGHNGKAYTGWATQNSTTDVVNTKTVLELTQVGCKITYQNTTVRLNGDNSQFALRMFGNECGVIVSGFDDAIAGGYFNGSIYIQKDKIYGFYSGNTLAIRSNIPQAQSWYSNTRDELVVMYIDNSNGYIKQWKIPTPVTGLVTTAVTAPATVTIWQNSATTSGLTANAPYFLKDTYTTIGDMSNTGTIPVGQALSTTVIDLS